METPAAPTVKYYYINLDRAADRRERCEAQAAGLGIELERIVAVDGRELSPDALDKFDRAACLRELTINEHACVLSHLRAVETFLASGAPFGIIMEDDFTLMPHTKNHIHHITTRTEGWECVKLYAQESKLYPVMERHSSDPCELVFPRKVLWSAVANLYTRKGAELLRDALQHYNQPFDSQLGCAFLSQGVPMCGVFPNAVSAWDPDNVASNIDRPEAPRAARKQRTPFGLYLRRRLHVWKVACDKLRMRRILKKRLRRK